MRKKRDYTNKDARKGMLFLLACCWISGLLCGVICFSVSSSGVISLMRRTVLSPVSIVGLLNAALIPFLLSALFSLLSIDWIVFCIVFIKAFIFSFVSLGLILSFGSGGWLLRFFLVFGDYAALPLLFWCWMRMVSVGAGRSVILLSFVCCALVIAIVLVYRVIAPFVCLIDSMKG